jgi:dipeptidyl aminopeptidase/acylaminoacyl peptidase
MRTVMFALLIAVPAVSGAAITNPRDLTSQTGAPMQPADPAKLSALTMVGGAVWSRDGRSIAYVSTETGMSRIHILDLVTGKSYQPAQRDGEQHTPRWSPDGTHLLFIADTHGDELYDVFLVDLNSGRVRNVTSTPDDAEDHAAWAPDSQQLVFRKRHKHAASSEIGVLNLSTGKIGLLTQNTSSDRTNIIPHWDAAGEWVYFNEISYSLADSSVIRVRANGSRRENLTPHEGEALFRIARVSPDGERVLVTSDARNGWRQVAVVSVRTRAIRWLTEDRANHMAAGFSHDGRHAIYSRDGEIDSQIFSYDLKTGQARQLTRGPHSYELNVSMRNLAGPNPAPMSSDGWILADKFSGTEPEHIVAINLQGEQKTLVNNPMPKALVNAVVQPVAVSYPSKDRKFMVPALVWVPRNLKRDGSHPAVIEIHGGPMDQTRPYLLTYIQVLVAQGYIVISPNFRGSTGYNREYFVANRMDFGGKDLDDVVAGGQFLLNSGFVDPKKLGVYGASYGGYLTLVAMSKFPEQWAAGVALVPFVDFPTMYATVTPWLQSIIGALMGDPAHDEKLWRERSPLSYADRIRAPLMMTAGANDPRCPPAQAREMERVIRSRGGIVELTIYGEQGHRAIETEDYADENTRVVEFINKHVRDRPSRTSGLPR